MFFATPYIDAWLRSGKKHAFLMDVNNVLQVKKLVTRKNLSCHPVVANMQMAFEAFNFFLRLIDLPLRHFFALCNITLYLEL